MAEPLGIALVGCGTVGGGVAKLLLEQRERLATRAGRPLVLRRVVVRDAAKARQRGYAEADPTLDVDGTDAAHKLAILAQIAFGVTVPVAAIERRGIADLQQMDLRFARELGYTIKLLAEAWLHDGKLALHV